MRLFVFIAALCAALSFSGCADPVAPARASGAAVVVKVRDGDSLVVRVDGLTLEVRLHGLDAPERGQAHGDEARQALVAMTKNKSLVLERRTVDRYDRHVALITEAGSAISVNQQMIAQGHAWHYVRYDQNPAWADAEGAARRAGRGLWAAAAPIPPWEWRKR